LDKTILDIENDIVSINEDKNIQIYNIMKQNNQVLNKLESYSQITRFMGSIDYIKKEYLLDLD
jgi:hypothetical protein